MTNLWYGPAGWSYADWKGRVYPDPAPRGFHPLTWLSGFVNLIEVNATFYAPLRAQSSADWLLRVAERPDFRFVIKVWQRLTHAGTRLPASAEVAHWAEVLEPLREQQRLLCLLVQFPFAFRDGPAQRDQLCAIRDCFPEDMLACEFRHASWTRSEALAFLREHRLAFVNIDQPQGRDSVPPGSWSTGPLDYVRLHGRNAEAWFDREAGRDARYDWHYSSQELREWVPHLRKLGQAGRPLLVVGNNHFHGKALAAVLGLVHALLGKRLPVPALLAGTFPELEALRRPQSGELF